MKKIIACILQHAPYASSCGREGLEAAQALAALDLEIRLCCMGNGLWHLVKEQHPKALSLKNYTKSFHSLSLYGIDTVYVSSADLTQQGLQANDLFANVTILEPLELADLIAHCDFSWGF